MSNEPTDEGREGPVTKSWVIPILRVLAPLTLAMAIAAGVTTMKAPTCAWVLIPGTVILSLVVLGLGSSRLAEIRRLQQAGLRAGQTLGGVVLLVLFVLAVGLFFFVSCAMNFSIGGH